MCLSILIPFPEKSRFSFLLILLSAISPIHEWRANIRNDNIETRVFRKRLSRFAIKYDIVYGCIECFRCAIGLRYSFLCLSPLSPFRLTMISSIQKLARCRTTLRSPKTPQLLRRLSLSLPRYDDTVQGNSSSRETVEVDRLDTLLTNIRHSSETHTSGLLSVRSPSFWSETLQSARLRHLSGVTSTSSTPHTLNTSDAETLPPRRMHESYCQMDLPFASNPSLLDQYTNAQGGIRTGKLMEHLDWLAGSISYKHCVSREVSL